MVHESYGLHHFSRRKRVHRKAHLQLKRLMDKAIYAVGAFSLLMTLPQLMKIWIEKNASGVSAVSWSAYLLVTVFWLFYGLIHREKPIIVINSLWIVMNALVIAGTLLYG